MDIPAEEPEPVFQLLDSKLEEIQQKVMTATRFNEIQEFAENMPNAPDAEAKWSIIDLSVPGWDYNMEFDLSEERTKILLTIGYIGFTLVISWGLLWTFFKLNAVLLAT